MCRRFNNKQPLRAVCAIAITAVVGIFALPGYGQANKTQASTSSTAVMFTDTRDGKTYRTVKIGELTWIAENLNYKADSSWCSYEADSNCVKFGRIYTWDAAMKACPAGWRLPTDADWDNLVKAAGNWEIAGKKLKSKTGWIENNNGTDEFGFSALPGGDRCIRGNFGGIGSLGSWWSATEDGSGRVYRRFMTWNTGVYRFNYYKEYGFSVRCTR